MQNPFANGPPPGGFMPMMPPGIPPGMGGHGMLPPPYGMFFGPPRLPGLPGGLMVPPPMLPIPPMPSAPPTFPPTVAQAVQNAPSTTATKSNPWVEYKTPEDRPYYFNSVTQAVVWEKPDELKTETERALLACPWKEYQTEDGKVYYSHEHTGASSWTIPPELAELMARFANNTTNASSKSNSNKTPAAEPSIIQDVEDPKKQQQLKTNTPSDHDETSNQSDSIPLPSNSRSTPKTSNSPQPEKELTKAEQFELFKDILREKNVSSTSSWENALKYVSSEPRFERFRSHPERKKFFNDYKVQRAREEKDELKAKIRKAKEMLDTFLRNSDRMNSLVTYRHACDVFRDHDAWKIIPDHDRREIFQTVVIDLHRKEHDETKARRKRNMRVLADILNSMINITARTTWSEAQHQLLDNITFASDQELLGMDKEDALIVFEEHIRQLEKEEEEEKEQERKMRRRNERINREGFIELLNELHRSGKLNSLSKWKNLFADISADPRFEMMLDQPLSGSTPLDLFKLYVEDLKARYEDEKVLIKDILRSNVEFVMGPNTAFSEFVDILGEDPLSAKLDSGNVKLMYEKLLAKEREKYRQQQRETMKRKKKLELKFIALLNKLEPPLTEDSTWEDIRPKICEELAFDEIETEQERRQIFEAAIESMMETCQHHHSNRAHKHKAVKKNKKRDYSSPSVSRSSSSVSRSPSPSRSIRSNSRRRRSRSSSSRSSRRMIRSPSASSVISGSSSVTFGPNVLEENSVSSPRDDLMNRKQKKSKKSKSYKRDRYRDEGEIDDENEDGEIRGGRSARGHDHKHRRAGSRDYVAAPPPSIPGPSSDYRRGRKTPSRSPPSSRYYRDERRSGRSPQSPNEKNGSSNRNDDHYHRGEESRSRHTTASSSSKHYRANDSPRDSKRIKQEDVGGLEELEMQRLMILKQLGKKV